MRMVLKRIVLFACSLLCIRIVPFLETCVCLVHCIIIWFNRIGGVMVGVPRKCAVYRGFEPRSGQTKDYKLGMCCFSAKYAALRRKNKDWLARNQINVSDWSDMFTHRLLFQ